MSQPSTAAANLSTTHQGFLTQTQLDQLFNTVGYDRIAYSQNPLDVAGGLDLQQYYNPPESAASTPAPRPELFDYNFDQLSAGYPTPGPNTPHPYPIEQQQCLNPTQAVGLASRQRPQPVRSYTNTSYLQPSHAPPSYTRRHSLSQGDIDHITALNAQTSNPIFMRLQTPRVRSESPGPHANKRRAGRHSRSTSQSTSSRGHHTHDSTPTSVPYHVNGLVPTHIGDPLSPCCPVAQEQWPVQDGYAEDDIYFRHMVRPEQMERSRRIIEIGAMTFMQHVDAALEQSTITVLQKLEEVEKYLKAECGKCDGALEGCATIRAALSKKESMTSVHKGASNLQDVSTRVDTLNAPSKMVSGSADDLSDNGNSEADGDALMDMLMQEHVSHCSGNDL